jgi:acyl phosphate:glycerol-3-phosphate acyltransferase
MIQPVDVILLVAAYIMGAIPFSLLVGKLFYKTDVRKFGSGNPGATNTLRTLGPKAGLSVLLLDILKGVIPVLLVYYFSIWPGIQVHDRMIIAGALAIAGHIFSPFLGFKGGKGVATSIGVILAIEPLFALGIVAVFVLTLWFSRFVSLSSIAAAFAFTLLTLLFKNDQYILVLFSICITLLIIIKHKDNITRLIRGEENRFTFRQKR